MKPAYAACILLPLATVIFACSPAEEEPADAPRVSETAIETITPEIPPPLITDMPPQPPGPPPQIVPTIPKPNFSMPKPPEGNPTLADAKARSQFFVLDNRSPIRNGVFERWEKPGPIHWSGNFTYKKPGDPPDPDIAMFPDTIEGGWALRFMPKGNYIEVWQDVKMPEELEGAPVLDIVAYARNPIVEGFAIRLTYATPESPHVAEVYPAQTDSGWTRYHARVELPANTGRKSVRLYLTRDPAVKHNIIVDAVSVLVLGAAGPPPQA